MENTATLEKILNVKEKEKEDAQLEKKEAVDYFEAKATELYQELKQKEKAEDQLNQVMKAKATITMIKEQSQYISMMKTKINTLQKNVQTARMDMEHKQELLTEAYIEVKKIERLIEIRVEEVTEQREKQEMALMDEISMRQYQKHIKNR